MKKQIITVQNLKELDACHAGIRAFKRAFPEGEVSVKKLVEKLESTKKVKPNHASYLWWIVINAGWVAFRYRVRIVKKQPDPAWCFGYMSLYASGLSGTQRIICASKTPDPHNYYKDLFTFSSTYGISKKQKLQLKELID